MISSRVQLAYDEAQLIDIGHPNSTCINGHPFFFVRGQAAELPGHIYSDAGMREFRISKCCEYCFDNMFDTDAEDDYIITEGEGLLY